jgi:hypothetical protein
MAQSGSLGTDQEYLLLKRLWPKVEPAVVVLIFCTQNDRLDNSTNIRYEGYQKPYFETASNGALVQSEQPVPISRLQYIEENWLVRNLWLARLVTSIYVKLKHPLLFVPDPTERLVGKMREFVETNGAKFLVGIGIQYRDEELVRYRQSSRIPFVLRDGAAAYPGLAAGSHWTPEGQKFVAARMLGLLAENYIVRTRDAGVNSP